MDKELLSIVGKRGGSTPKHKWTENERDIVRRDYNGTNDSAEQIASKLGVTRNAVKGQVEKMGLAVDKSRRWSLREEEKLTELITQYAPQTVAIHLHRSVNSVVVKSKRLGLSRRFRDGWYTKHEVCELFGVDHHWVQKRIDEDLLKASYHNGIKPQKSGGACWHIEEGELREFIVVHCGELVGRNVDLFTIVHLLVDENYEQAHKQISGALNAR